MSIFTYVNGRWAYTTLQKGVQGCWVGALCVCVCVYVCVTYLGKELLGCLWHHPAAHRQTFTHSRHQREHTYHDLLACADAGFTHYPPTLVPYIYIYVSLILLFSHTCLTDLSLTHTSHSFSHSHSPVDLSHVDLLNGRVARELA